MATHKVWNKLTFRSDRQPSQEEYEKEFPEHSSEPKGIVKLSGRRCGNSHILGYRRTGWTVRRNIWRQWLSLNWVSKRFSTYRNAPTAAREYWRSRKPCKSIMLEALIFLEGGSLVFINAQATHRHARAVKAVALTAHRNPILSMRCSNMIGNTMPPTEAPEPAQPKANALRRRNQCPSMLRAGVKLRCFPWVVIPAFIPKKTYTRAVPMPNSTPCDRKNWYSWSSWHKEVKIMDITKMNEPNGMRTCQSYDSKYAN